MRTKEEILKTLKDNEVLLERIETPDYVLAISDEKINYDDYYVSWETNYSTEPKERFVVYVKSTRLNGSNPKKIIAHKPKNNAKELDLPLLPEIVVEDDVEKLALQDFKDNDDGFISYKDRTDGFISGYNSATKVYSEEDMIRMAIHCWSIASKPDCEATYDVNQIAIDYMKFIKQSTPKWFVAEMECKTIKHISWGKELESKEDYEKGYPVTNHVLKTTTINDKTYLVGKFINK